MFLLTWQSYTEKVFEKLEKALANENNEYFESESSEESEINEFENQKDLETNPNGVQQQIKIEQILEDEDENKKESEQSSD